MDWLGWVSTDPENPEAVTVDKIKLDLSDQQMEQLRRNINPPEKSNSEGITLYLQTIDLLSQCLES